MQEGASKTQKDFLPKREYAVQCFCHALDIRIQLSQVTEDHLRRYIPVAQRHFVKKYTVANPREFIRHAVKRFIDEHRLTDRPRSGRTRNIDLTDPADLDACCDQLQLGWADACASAGDDDSIYHYHHIPWRIESLMLVPAFQALVEKYKHTRLGPEALMDVLQTHRPGMIHSLRIKPMMPKTRCDKRLRCARQRLHLKASVPRFFDFCIMLDESHFYLQNLFTISGHTNYAFVMGEDELPLCEQDDRIPTGDAAKVKYSWLTVISYLTGAVALVWLTPTPGRVGRKYKTVSHATAH